MKPITSNTPETNRIINNANNNLSFYDFCITGVLIACYLIYTLRISASEAVHYVRMKRPCSIQTRVQINLVFDFARLLGSQLAQYPMLNIRHGAPFSIRQYLQRQALLLHGDEAHSLAHTPKILHFICSLLTALAQGTSSPPEVWRELENKAAILVLQQAVRNVLVSRRYFPVLVDGEDSCESISSWCEPFGFLERKREMLLNKRSYSESDLSKISVNKVRTKYNCISYRLCLILVYLGNSKKLAHAYNHIVA